MRDKFSSTGFLFKLSFCVGVIGFDYADTIIKSL